MNISVEGNSNNVAGRDLVFNQERPFQERLLEELTVKRNLKYANWKKYSDQRNAVNAKNPSHVSRLSVSLSVLTFDLLYVLFFIYPALNLWCGTEWYALEQAINLPLMPIDAAVTIGLALIALQVFAFKHSNNLQDKRERKFDYLTTQMIPLAKEINDLDTEIEALSDEQAFSFSLHNTANNARD